QPTLEFWVGNIFDADVGAIIIFAGNGDHCSQATDIAARIGDYQLKEAPCRVATEFGPTTAGNRRIVNSCPVDLAKLFFEHGPATGINAPSKEANGNGASPVFTVS